MAARCLFFACVMTSSWGSIPEGVELKGTDSREKKKGERERHNSGAEKRREASNCREIEVVVDGRRV